jgi:TRAP-type mannitol/chloroaromatic compound transport system permease small subunit
MFHFKQQFERYNLNNEDNSSEVISKISSSLILIICVYALKPFFDRFIFNLNNRVFMLWNVKFFPSSAAP